MSSPEQRIIDFATTVQSFILERSDAFLVSALAMELMDHIAAFHEPIQQYFSAWSDALADLLTPLHGGKRAQSLSVNSLSYLQGVQIMARVNRDPAMLHQVQSFFLESWRI